MKSALIKGVIATLFIIAMVEGRAQAESKLVLGADYWCPFNCVPGADKPGFMIEVAREVFSEIGYDVEYKLMPWKQALDETRNGEIDAIVGAYVGDAPDLVFPETPEGVARVNAFKRFSDHWVFKGPASLMGKKVGIIQSYDYGEALNSYFYSNRNDFRHILVFSGSDSPQNLMFTSLMRGDIDVVFMEESVGYWTLRNLAMTSEIESAGVVQERQSVYIAFSPTNKKSSYFASVLSDGIVKLRRKGKLSQILSKYNLKDWSK